MAREFDPRDADGNPLPMDTPTARYYNPRRPRQEPPAVLVWFGYAIALLLATGVMFVFGWILTLWAIDLFSDPMTEQPPAPEVGRIGEWLDE